MLGDASQLGEPGGERSPRPLTRPAAAARAAALGAALLAFAFALGLQRTLNFDYGWHLRAGSWIFEHASVPRVDPWSLSHEGERWIDLHWLFQLGLFGLWSVGGHAAVTIAKAILVAAVAALVSWTARFRSFPAISTLASAAVLVVAAPRLIVRPELVSLVLLASQLALFELFERRQGRSRCMLAVLAIQLLWANLHGLFAVGLAVIALHVGAEILRGLVGAGWRGGRLRTLGLVLGGSLVATLCNPNGLEGALFPLRQLGIVAANTATGSDSLLSEMLRTLDPRVGLAPGARVAFLSLAAATALSMLAAFPRLRIVDPLLYGAFLYLALAANRNVALFAIVCGPILARNLAIAIERLAPLRFQRLTFVSSTALMAALLWIAVETARGSFYPFIAYEREPGLGLQTAWYPEGATEFIRAHNIPGPVANYMGDGGHLLFHLPPNRRILTDGRFAGLGGERRFQFSDLADLDRLQREHRFGCVVVAYAREPREAFLREVHRGANWRIVFVDDVSIVLVPWAQASTRHLKSIEPGSEEPFTSIAIEDSAAARRYAARAAWFSAGDRYDRAVDAITKASALRGLPDASPVRASWLLRAGDRSAARSEALRAAAESRDAWELTGLANLLLRLDERAAAETALERAVAIDSSYSPAQRSLHVLAAPGPESVRRALALPRPSRSTIGPSGARVALENLFAIGFGVLVAAAAARRTRRKASA